jgi:putative addiction module CopG family antidote
MNIQLTPEMSKYVAQRVQDGTHASPEDVVNAALADAKAREELTAADVAELRAMIAVGIQQADRGESASWNVEALKTRLRERLQRKAG